MGDPVDISDLVRALCKRLDVDYEAVSTIQLSPSEAVVHILMRNAAGSFFIDPKTEGRAEARLRIAVLS